MLLSEVILHEIGIVGIQYFRNSIQILLLRPVNAAGLVCSQLPAFVFTSSFVLKALELSLKCFFFCFAVLAEDAIKAALADYKLKQDPKRESNKKADNA